MRRWSGGAGSALFVAVAAALSAGCLAGAVRPPPADPPPACLSLLDEPLPAAPAGAAPQAVDATAGLALDGLGRAAACQDLVCPGGSCAGPGPQAARAALAARQAALQGRLAELRRELEAALQARELEAQAAARARELEARQEREALRRLELELRHGINKGIGPDGDRPPAWEVKSPPPPPRPAPPPPGPEEVTRFPTIEAPPKVQPGESFGVLVSLAAERFDAGTQVVQGRPGAEAGSLVLPLTPLAPDAAAWKVRVQLSVTGGLELVGPNTGELVLPRAGDSTPASFQVRAGPGASEGFVYATFFEGHAFLGRVRRPVGVVAPGIAAAPAPPEGRPAPGAAPRGLGGAPAAAGGPSRRPQAVEVGGAAARPPDLSVTIHVGFDPAKPRQAELLFDSPWISVPRTVWDVPADLAGALGRDYATFANRSARGLVRPGAGAEPSARELLLGFGRRQWQAAPLALQVALERLLAARGAEFTTIQIVTNEPSFPWELVALPDGQLLGTRLAVARWHLAESGGVRMRPPQRLRLDGVSLLAPAYQGRRRLPAQEAEVEAVRGAARGRGEVRVWIEEAAAGRSWLQARLQDDGQAGAYALHFAGHGEVDPGGAGAYRLDLGQDGLTSTEWRELAAGGRAPPFLFLNACNLAQVERVAGLADGWAPASLEAGVAGYVGGLWPIGDRAAAEAARVFYEAALGGVPVAEALRRTRARFLEAGDPTFLAYVYYGDPRLAFEVAAPPGR